MLRVYLLLLYGIVCLFFPSFICAQTPGLLRAVDDVATTGPMRAVRINVIVNDTMPCIDSYTWRVTAAPDPLTQGTIETKGDFLVFRPGMACRNMIVRIPYAVKCVGSHVEAMAAVVITVTNYSFPVNVLPMDLGCETSFPLNVGFDVEEMFRSDKQSPSHANPLLIYSLPIVGDLNGDRKPEILATGISSYTGRVTASARYITILDGQTGKRLVEHDAGFTFVVSRADPNPSAYHSSPSYMAIADVDHDGKGEIIVAFPGSTKLSGSVANLQPDNGRVIAYKIVTNSANEITGLQPYWQAEIGYKAPLNNTRHLAYDVPTPYIVDLNGDGVPEVIVYNKIYNAQTGRLLMAWDGPAAVPVNSSLASAGVGLLDFEDSEIYTKDATSNTVYNRAFVGRRPSTSTSDYKDDYIAVFAVENMDGDEAPEVVAGNRIYKFRFNYLGKDGEAGDHTDNTYTTIEGPRSVTLPTTGSNTVTYYLSDGFTRVADVDVDGYPDVINVSEIWTSGTLGPVAGLITVWDPRSPNEIKAASAFYGNGGNSSHIPAFGIPFVGDINGEIDGGWDGTLFTKKLPEIGLLTGNLYINSSDNMPKRNGITFHPLSDKNLRQNVEWNNNSASGHFNRSVPNGQGHIFALTYCDSAGIVPFHRRLKLCWAMEHNDRSANTGLTIFDFNNDGANDLVYRDEKTLRVISPRYNGGKDYVTVSEDGTEANTSVMFSTSALSLTGYEAAIVADVNMDASADIVVINQTGTNFSSGFISVFRYKSGTDKWSPAPPVWNQAYYNPRHIGEDLIVSSRPIPMLTPYTDGNGNRIYPYNGAWEQLSYVKDGAPYTPLVRHPDAELLNMAVTVDNAAGTTAVTLTIRNRGSASIAKNTPITFYDGGPNPGTPDVSGATRIGSFRIGGEDIFPDESVSHTFTLQSFNGVDRLIWVRIMDDNGAFPAAGFRDCDLTNNTASGAYCPNMSYSITPPGDVDICENDTLMLTATPASSSPVSSPTYQWFRNESIIADADGATYIASSTGHYTCFVTDGICRQYTSPKAVTVYRTEAHDDQAVAIRGIATLIRVTANDTLPAVCTTALAVETMPVHGTASVSGDGILYTSHDDYTGMDEFVYSLANGKNAAVRIRVVEAPDHIDSVACIVNVTADHEWKMREMSLNLRDTVDNCGPLTVGDIDGDGRVEALAYKPHLPAGGATDSIHKRPGMKIFHYNKVVGRMEPKRAFDFHDAGGTAFTSSAMGAPAIARYNNGGYIVVLNSDDFHLYAFDENGDFRWKSGAPATESKYATMIGIADFNGDGIPEVFAGNKIFSLAGGNLLCDGNGNDGSVDHNKGILPGNEGYLSVAVDMDGDGLPELCAGTQIYKVEIPAGATDADTGTIDVIEDMQLDAALLPAEADKDGATQVADIDNDGRPEVVVISLKAGNTVVYVWKPLPNHQSYLLGSYTVSGTDACYGIPVTGNIDATPYPEILFVANMSPHEVHALEYLPGHARGSQIAEKWRMSVSGASKRTGMSLFDFDQDGIPELVYRDETTLYIIDGNVSSPASPVIRNTSDNVTSRTLREMPVVADIDGDGQAEIIVSGGRNVAGAGSQAAADNEKHNGYLRVFKSAGTPWASARKVWNQYAYQAFHVNNDLTVPRYMANPSTLFPGENGTFGDLDDVRPYNAFLQQLSVFDHRGIPCRLAPNGEIVGTPVIRHYAEDDSLSVSFVITNTGNAGYQQPLYVTAYKNGAGVGDEVATDSILSPVNTGDTVAFALSIAGFSAHYPVKNITVRLNDKGNVADVQAECTSFNFKTTQRNGILLAHNDGPVHMLKNRPVEIPILANDSIPATCSHLTVEIIKPPRHGAMSLGNDHKIRYEPSVDYLGLDSITYRLACNGDTATAVVKILVNNKPDNMNKFDCYNTTSPGSIGVIEMKARSDKQVYWLATPFVGDLDNDGRSEIIVPGVKDKDDNATSILIFDDKLKTKWEISLYVKMLAYNTMAFLVADVDNDHYGEIVFCATSKVVYCLAYDGTMKKWVQRWVSKNAYGGDATICPSPIIADINGDGESEILISDKLLAGKTGVELLTLPTGGRGRSEGSPASYMPVFADVDNDGIQEIVAGNTVYKATITNRTGTTGNTVRVLAKAPNGLPDGFTSVADIDLDGDPDVIVTGGGATNNTAIMYVWDGATSTQIGHTITVSSNNKSISRPSVGNIRSEDNYPEIVFVYNNMLDAYRYDPSTKTIVRFLQKTVKDNSGSMSVSLFDFDQNGEVEMVYRDENTLYIMEKNGTIHSSIPCGSQTHTEYPVIVDLDHDGHADILVSGVTAGYEGTRIVHYGSKNPGKWGPARHVWNQHGYNSIHINDNLSVPKFSLNPAALFPGKNGTFGDNDDVRPYNNFLQQQTPLDFNGIVRWPEPDVVPLESKSKIERLTDNKIAVTVAVCNMGSRDINPPVYATLYKGDVSAANLLATVTINERIHPGDTVIVTTTINTPVIQMIVRVNDNGGLFPYVPECKNNNNELSLFNSYYSRFMQKNAWIDGVYGNGYYGNPVAVLYSETIHYMISAYNVSQNVGTVIVTDTLPAYMQYVPGTASPVAPGVFLHTKTNTTPPRDILKWTLNNVPPQTDAIVDYKAQPAPGVCASQPLFINRAWIRTENMDIVTNNSTYHQGAGAGLVTFSADRGGTVYNARPQVVDYRTSPGEGVLAVPDEGYAFAGWSHDEYYSLRGEPVKARSGILHYDTLPILGNVELTACFEPVRYPIRYYLNGGEIAGNGNPTEYTVQSSVLTLEEPLKAGDEFIGWTGSNGATPRKTVIIPEGSTGELEFYANYLYSGREDPSVQPEADRIWSADDELYIHTSCVGSIVRIYTPEGRLIALHTILSSGVTKIKLRCGLYIVTLNNAAAQKVVISD